MRILLLLAVLTISAAPAHGKTLKTFEGSFEKIQQGDYTHLYLIHRNGKKMSFVCTDLPKSLIKGIDCFEIESKHRKDVLKVTYYEETNFIPEANKKITWNYVDKIEIKRD